MIQRIYKITAINSKEETDAIEQRIADGEFNNFYDWNFYREQIAKSQLLKVDSAVDIFQLDEFLLSKVITITSKMGYRIVVQDVTVDMFNGKEPIPEAIKEVVEKFLMTSFDPDDVLDKMLNGYELNELDKLILQSK